MNKRRKPLTEVMSDPSAAKETQAEPSATSSQSKTPASKRSKWVQMNVFVPPDVRQALKIRALQEDRQMSDIVTELLRDYLGKQIAE